MRSAAFCLLFGLCLSSCSGTWLGARGRDASQVLHLGLGGSLTPGVYAQAMAPLFGTSLGWMRDAAYVGNDYGYAHIWRQSAHGAVIGGELARATWPLPLDDFGYRHDLNAYLDQSHFVVINMTVTDQRSRVLSSIQLSRAEAQLHALFVGLSVGVDFVEMFDFFAGWVGFDPVSDDEWIGLRAPFTPLEEEADAS